MQDMKCTCAPSSENLVMKIVLLDELLRRLLWLVLIKADRHVSVVSLVSIVCLAKTREGFLACTNDREPRKDFNSDSYVHCLRLETDIPMQGTQAQREGYCILVLLR